MLSLGIIESVCSEAQSFWNEEVAKPYFAEYAQGKEIGHRIADLVDDKTTGLLAIKHMTKYQRDKSGKKVMRSMGDIWLEEGEVYHPINVKTGVSTTDGQPNMVSMKKLLRTLLRYQIDSYYLLMVNAGYWHEYRVPNPFRRHVGLPGLHHVRLWARANHAEGPRFFHESYRWHCSLTSFDCGQG